MAFFVQYNKMCDKLNCFAGEFLKNRKIPKDSDI